MATLPRKYAAALSTDDYWLKTAVDKVLESGMHKTLIAPQQLQMLSPENMVERMPYNMSHADIIKKTPVAVPVPGDSLALTVQVQAALSGHPIHCQRVTQVILQHVQAARTRNRDMSADQLLGVTVHLEALDYVVRVVVDAWLTAAHIQVIDTRNAEVGTQLYKEISYEEFEAHKNAIRKSQGRE